MKDFQQRIERLQDRANVQLGLLADSCRDLFSQFEVDTAVFEGKLADYQSTVTAVEAVFEAPKKAQLPMIERLRDRAIDKNIWLWCYANQTLLDAGAIPNKDDIEPRRLLTCMDITLYRIGSLLKMRYPWLTDPDVAAHIAARNFTLEALGMDHVNEWK